MKNKKISKLKVINHIENQKKLSFTEEEYNILVNNLFKDTSKKQEQVLKKADVFIYNKDENTSLVSDDTSFLEKISRNFSINFSLVAKIFSKKFFTSGVLLAFLGIPVLLGVILTNNLLSFTQPNYDYATFSNTFIDPLLIITLIFIPSFILGIRNDALIKRLRIYGVTKEQFNFTVSIMTLALTFIVMIVIMIPLTLIGNLVDNAIINDENRNIKFSLSGINWGVLIPLLILSILSFTQFGIFIGMKSKGTKTSIIGGYGIVFLISFLTNYHSGGYSVPNKNLVPSGLYSFLAVMRWMFCISPFTVVIKGITLCFHHVSSFKYSDKLKLWVWVFSYLLVISGVIVPVVLNNKLIKFNGLR